MSLQRTGHSLCHLIYLVAVLHHFLLMRYISSNVYQSMLLTVNKKLWQIQLINTCSAAVPGVTTVAVAICCYWYQTLQQFVVGVEVVCNIGELIWQ